MFLLFTPTLMYLAIYIGAALLPAVFLMRYIYSQDTVEKEPGYLLWKLIRGGVLAALLAMLLEMLADKIVLPALLSQADDTAYAVGSAIAVGLIEEGSKMFFLHQRTWNEPNFNYRYDGVVYAVFVSLGFAAFENILYVFMYGLSIAVTRALLAVPAHMGFAVFMGSFYGRAKICEVRGDGSGRTLNLWAGYLIAVTLHAFYDGTLMIGDSMATVFFVIFVVLMYILVIRRVRKESRTDEPIY